MAQVRRYTHDYLVYLRGKIGVTRLEWRCSAIAYEGATMLYSAACTDFQRFFRRLCPRAVEIVLWTACVNPKLIQKARDVQMPSLRTS